MTTMAPERTAVTSDADTQPPRVYHRAADAEQTGLALNGQVYLTLCGQTLRPKPPRRRSTLSPIEVCVICEEYA
jgi:hypothetical protein